jgi:hypothetical protein
MLARCSFGPFMIPKLHMNVIEPHVKDRANFWGFNAIMGRPTKNANEKKRADRNKSAQKTCRERTKGLSHDIVVIAKGISRAAPVGSP